ncbi:putative bifunctional diguanylate cyclase/phosphodiesterase [Clostridium sp. 'White wine YQ']|uniref:putative bifunctional diguanylate cyclase/phosphodiesterase n=1 Tax=Clostridium sp. 'White wine YQ' TaxID=3027474 RepID=UPI002364FD50|nr:bifunctional diguanylate cyclase/phosphodiesterase [Clostridium sp. 'White wine YQ']MDD7794196.1 bifunctional diguanylate cyclase/phosphodiesterase [Clostridium sp. 'White wine YQ']
MNLSTEILKGYFIFLHFLVVVMFLMLIVAIMRDKKSGVKVENTKKELKETKEELKKQYDELVEKDEKIKYLVNHDRLTKLCNKSYLIKRLCGIVDSENKTKKFALLFLDIGDFKNTNDILGHHYGDQLLILIAQKLRKIKDDKCSVYRWGGDEFIVLFDNYKEKTEVIALAESVINNINDEFKIGGKKVYVSLNIGIAIYPYDGTDINNIIKNSEVALYEAKKLGKNKYRFYDKMLFEKIYRKDILEKYLRNSIKNNELSIKYQPQYNVESRKIIGYEALLRWNSKELGEISPVEFISVAEDSGLIISLGEWILREACRQNSKWIEKGIKNIIAINISPIQFEQRDFVEIVRNVLEENNLEPEQLELEITETALIKSLDRSIKTLEKLKKLGVKVSLDDFGTGYSSLNYLKNLPIDNLKIDKSFINDIAISDNSKHILTGIIQLAHMLNLKVIAEGIETDEQYEILKKINCDIAQGFLLSKPISKNEIEKLLTID